MNMLRFLIRKTVDGIDIDWEYPGYAPHSGTPADKENYTYFLKAIRDALDALEAETGKFYGLTAGKFLNRAKLSCREFLFHHALKSHLMSTVSV